MSKSSHEKLSHESVDGKKEHKLMRKGLAVALAGAVALGAAGCSGDKVGAQAPEVKPSTTTEAPATPTEVEAPENYTDQFIDDMEVYKDMSVEEFETLPREDRLKYAQFLIDQTVERGNYEKNYGINTRGENYSVDVMDLGLESSGQDILNNNIFCLQVAYLQFIEADYENKSFDSSDAQKLLSSIYYNVGSGIQIPEEYFLAKDSMAAIDKPSIVAKEVEIVSETTELKDGIDINGSRIQYKDVVYDSLEDEEPRILRFVYTEFKDYSGKNRGTWLLETKVSSQDDLSRFTNIK